MSRLTVNAFLKLSDKEKANVVLDQYVQSFGENRSQFNGDLGTILEQIVVNSYGALSVFVEDCDEDGITAILQDILKTQDKEIQFFRCHIEDPDTGEQLVWYIFRDKQYTISVDDLCTYYERDVIGKEDITDSNND